MTANLDRATALKKHSVEVVGLHEKSKGVLVVELADSQKTPLPAWEPGEHIDIELAPGVTRQYSLCGDLENSHTWSVAVRLAEEGRGGSRHVHEKLQVGDAVRVAGPRQHFPLMPAERYLLVAGGIGVTPLIPMIQRLEQRDAEWRMVYFGRELDRMPFLDYLAQWPDRCIVVDRSIQGALSLEEVLSTTGEDTLVYGCGPQSLLDELKERVSPDFLRIEDFEMSVGDNAGPNEGAATHVGLTGESFEVQLGHGGQVLAVPPDKCLLDILLDSGADIMWSCREGNCASCEVDVLDGIPEHRDVILSDDERAANDVMFPCVSRAKSKRLVLDIEA